MTMAAAADQDDYFDLFNVPASYAVDGTLLRKHYLTLQQQFHPDRFSGESDQIKRIAVQKIAFINEAYQTLNSQQKRARYLLKRAGVSIDEQRGTAVDIEFLTEQMEWREQLADLILDEGAGRCATLNTLEDKVKVRLKDINATLTTLFAADDLSADESIAEYHKLQFMEKLHSEIADLQEECF